MRNFFSDGYKDNRYASKFTFHVLKAHSIDYMFVKKHCLKIHQCTITIVCSDCEQYVHCSHANICNDQKV